MSYTHNVLRLKTAKAIINRCYDADKSAAMSADELSVHGNSIDAIAVKGKNGWDITINSSVYELATLKSLIDDVYNAIAARKAAN